MTSAAKEFRTVQTLVGPLMYVGGVQGIGYSEIAEVLLPDGSVRRGKVLETQEDRALVQVFEGTSGIDPGTARVRFTGKGLDMGLSPDLLGRVFDGFGRPADGGPPILPEKRATINGVPINPFARDYPDEFVQTGLSAIDVLNPLVRGQKLPIFSGSGLPHNRIAAQIARQAATKKSDEKFGVVFAAMGITFEESHFFIEEFSKSGALERSVLFLNLANDPPIERISVPRFALTCAEYLAFDLGMHILVILTDMTNYCEALREISAARKEVPGRRGYPGYLYTDLSTLYERAGRLKGREGSVTQLPILTMPDDDKTHPVPDLSGYITEGQIILQRGYHAQGVYPPVDVLPSLSRLKDKGIGAGKTREDHAGVMNQLYACYAKGMNARELAVVLGESALTPLDLVYLDFVQRFESEFLAQGEHENRAIEDALDLGWKLLGLFPRGELKRIRPELVEKYYPAKDA